MEESLSPCRLGGGIRRWALALIAALLFACGLAALTPAPA